MTHPMVSIIIATYNRSNVLKLAMESALLSTFNDWEMIVVSDASTDDTAHVVSSFTDPRIRFIDLEENIGVQSGPNNIGVENARGTYIAFLNHDDLWFPNHLEKLLSHLKTHNADWVVSQAFYMTSRDDIELTGVFPELRYDPFYGYAPATMWLVKKEVLQKLGGWRMHYETILAPSQDTLFRGYKSGAKIITHPYPTAILFPSGTRIDCYTNSVSRENEQYLHRIKTDPNLHSDLLSIAYTQYYGKSIKDSFSIVKAIKKLFIAFIKRTGKLFGIYPWYISAFIKHGRKGRFINKIRVTRGLKPIPKKK